MHRHLPPTPKDLQSDKGTMVMGIMKEVMQKAEREYQQKLMSKTESGFATSLTATRQAEPSWLVKYRDEPFFGRKGDGYKEQYDTIKSNLLSRYDAEKLKTMVFTSTGYGEGTSTTALNVAAALAVDPWRSVLLIDADIRKPCLHEVFNVDLANGLSDFLSADKIIEPHSNKIGNNFYFFTSGLMGKRALGRFESDRFEKLLEAMKDRFDYVILDCPPISKFPETRTIARKAAGVVLVVNCGQTRQCVAMRARKELTEAGANLLGVVLNRRKYHIPNWLYKRL